MRSAGSLTTPAGLGLGDHVCWVYEDEASWRNAAAIHLHEGARAGDRLLYVADARETDLIADLISLPSREEMLASGQLGVASTADTLGLAAGFDSARQVQILRHEALSAAANGYRGLRLVVEGTALATKQADMHRFAAYEMTVDGMVASSPLSLMCGYDEGRVGEGVSALCCVHPLRSARGPAAACTLYIDDGHWRLTGEVDLAVVDDVRNALDTAASLSIGELAVDLDGLHFIDVPGARTLVQLAGRLAPGRRLMLHNPPYPLTRILQTAWGTIPGLEVVGS